MSWAREKKKQRVLSRQVMLSKAKAKSPAQEGRQVPWRELDALRATREQSTGRTVTAVRMTDGLGIPVGIFGGRCVRFVFEDDGRPSVPPAPVEVLVVEVEDKEQLC